VEWCCPGIAILIIFLVGVFALGFIMEAVKGERQPNRE
jgi:hypothetical protein